MSDAFDRWYAGCAIFGGLALVAFFLTVMIMELHHINLVDNGDGYGVWGDPEVPNWAKELFHISSWGGEVAGNEDFHDWVADEVHHINILDTNSPADAEGAVTNSKGQMTGQFNIKFFTGKEVVEDSQHYVSYMVVNKQIFEGDDVVEIFEFPAVEIDPDTEAGDNMASEMYESWNEAYKKRRFLDPNDKGLARFFPDVDGKVDLGWIFETLPETALEEGSTRTAVTVDVLGQNPHLIDGTDVLGDIITTPGETEPMTEKEWLALVDQMSGQSTGAESPAATERRRLLPMQRLLHDISLSA